MNFIERYDSWLRAEVKAALDWLYEWFSISQKAVERVLIGLYVFANLLEILGINEHKFHGPLWLEIFFACAITAWMLALHNEPAAVKTNRALEYKFWRIVFQPFVLISFSILLLPECNIYDIGHFLEDGAFTCLIYVFSCNSEGERGRRRKMALEKLKELFSWLPAPQPEGF